MTGDPYTEDRLVEQPAIALFAAYTEELYHTKCNVLFEHVYESYYGEGGSVYAEVA